MSTTSEPKFNFGLKTSEEIRASNNAKVYQIQNIQITKLQPFRNHPFKLYEGQRFDDICDSIKENGVLLPIIVRPVEDGNYEILSGHNRTEAAKAAGLTVVPAIIRENLTDDEALLIVTETNLIQRSFADLSHSERAVILTTHYNTIRLQGKRTELMNEIDDLFNNPEKISNNADFEAVSQVGKKVNSMVKLGEDYGLSKNSVARYLRINMLIDPLKIRLDGKEFGLIPAVEVSYLTCEEQDDLNMLLDSPIYKLDMKKAAQLREFSAKKTLDTDTIEEILAGLVKKRRSNAPKIVMVKLKPKKLAKYFTAEQKSDEIEAEIFEALAFYRANKPKSVDNLNE